MNEQNLTPFTSDQSREEAAKNGRKGGIASGESRRQKRTLRELCEYIGAMKSNSPLVQDLPEELRTNDSAIAVAQILAAAAGDTKAATWVRDTKGESQLNINATEQHKIIFVDE